MEDVTPVFSSNRPIKDECVTFVVDTNVLMEFQSPEQIDWSLLCPCAKSVRIVVPATVVAEIDKHKKGRGRIRRRAFEFNKLLQVIEDGDGTNATLQNANVGLSLRLMERYARSELDEGKLSLDVPDDLIIAEAVKFIRDHGDAVFLADDTNARRAAREMGVCVARPAENWRRAEPKDPRDERIEELERQVGAMPRLSLCLLDQEENAVAFESLDESNVPVEFLEAVAQEILKKNLGVDRDELLRRHNLPSEQFALGIRFNPFAVTLGRVDRYCDEYRQYREQMIAWSRQLPEMLGETEFLAPILLQVTNDGEAFAEDVEVTLSASKGYRFSAPESVKSLLQSKVQPPEPPASIAQPKYVQSILELRNLHRKDAFAFHIRNAPDRESTAPQISYECERFRHGKSAVLTSILFKTENAPTGGKLTIRASSASMADPVELRCPIMGSPERRSTDYRRYFRQWRSFFPEDVDDVVSKVLAEYKRDV